MSAAPDPWYRDGLRFTCTRCGNCCTGAPGYVWVDPQEIERLAEVVGLSIEDFGARYLRRVGQRISLIERPNGDCIFWDGEAGCTVYEGRPTQCRTWPFWPDTIETPEDWEALREGCPGAGHGQWFSVEQIEAAASRTTS